MPSWIEVWAETDGAGANGRAMPVMEVFDWGGDNPLRGDAGRCDSGWRLSGQAELFTYLGRACWFAV